MPGAPPPNPPLFHITHVSNVASIVRDGCLWSDSERVARDLTSTNIGHRHIKERRLRRDVPVAARGKLGDYVPFYFCNRSVMLYVVSRGHPDYAGDQQSIVHLVSSTATATRLGLPWAFTDRHAELGYAAYYDDLAKLGEIDWNVMPLRYWNEKETKERRQAEFLVHRRFPWSAIERIGVLNDAVANQVRSMLGNCGPSVEVQPTWYY